MVTDELPQAILTLLKTGPLYPEEVRQKLKPYGERLVRDAVAQLWAHGEVNLGLDRKLYRND